MEISAEKTNQMANNTSGINTEIKVNGQKFETVTSFKYLGSVITDEGSKLEILSRIAQTTAAMKSQSYCQCICPICFPFAIFKVKVTPLARIIKNMTVSTVSTESLNEIN